MDNPFALAIAEEISKPKVDPLHLFNDITTRVVRLTASANEVQKPYQAGTGMEYLFSFKGANGRGALMPASDDVGIIAPAAQGKVAHAIAQPSSPQTSA